MSFKKPVIACTDGGGYAELIKDGINGFLVEPTSEAIANAIGKLAEDKELAKQMGLNAYETSRNYSWKNAMSQLNASILSL
ncbi:D-inositol-3-phosphate glycosyltransferase [compost metagenome]